MVNSYVVAYYLGVRYRSLRNQIRNLIDDNQEYMKGRIITGKFYYRGSYRECYYITKIALSWLCKFYYPEVHVHELFEKCISVKENIQGCP